MEQQANPVTKQKFKIAAPNGEAVDLKKCVESGTGGLVFFGHLVLWTLVVILSVASGGILLIVMLFAPLIEAFNRKKAEATLRGSALQIGPNQFGELYESAKIIAQRLGLKNVPDIFLLEDNTINAAAGKVGSRSVIVLVDDTVNACILTGNLQSLNFILAHEMAHHAFGHTNMIRGYLSQMLKSLSRKDEFSCDRVASEIVNDSEAAVDALCILLAGPQLYPYLERDALIQQAAQVERNKHSKKAEKTMTHPLMLRRIYRALGGDAEAYASTRAATVEPIPEKSSF